MVESEFPSELFPKEKIKLIIQAINQSVPQYFKHINDEKLPTQDGKYLEIWNYIFKNIVSAFADFPYKCYKISRGSLWEFIAIYNESDQMLYIVMKEERLNQIRKGNDNDFHYIKILNTINNDLNKIKYEQMSLFPNDEQKENRIKDDLVRMLQEINGDIKMCVDILFSQKQNKVTAISGNILDYSLNLLKTYCWNNYIEADIDEISDTKDDCNSENPLIPLTLKKHSQDTIEQEKEKTNEMAASKEMQKRKSEGK